MSLGSNKKWGPILVKRSSPFNVFFFFPFFVLGKFSLMALGAGTKAHSLFKFLKRAQRANFYFYVFFYLERVFDFSSDFFGETQRDRKKKIRKLFC